MVVLTKIKAATLVETIVASAIIVVIFLIASLSINNVFKNTVANNDFELNNRIKEITYLAKNKKINFPYLEETPRWIITIDISGEKLSLFTENKMNGLESKSLLYYED